MIEICLEKNKALNYQLNILFETNYTLSITFSENEFLSLLTLLKVKKNGYTIKFHRWSDGKYSIEIESYKDFHLDFYIGKNKEVEKFINFEKVTIYADSFKLAYYEENQWKMYNSLKNSLDI
tara:strand:- start:166 stop:531 length:366 start_codon:yes stop_codon:yes gene_type:complete